MSGSHPPVDPVPVLRLLRQGLTIPVVAERVGCTERTVQRIKERRNLTKPYVAFTEDEARRAHYMLAVEGCSYAEVARTLGRTDTCIRGRFPGMGWDRRQRRDWAALCMRNRHARKRLDLEVLR